MGVPPNHPFIDGIFQYIYIYIIIYIYINYPAVGVPPFMETPCLFRTTDRTWSSSDRSARLQVFPKDLHGAWAEKNTGHWFLVSACEECCFTKQYFSTNQTSWGFDQARCSITVMNKRRWLCVFQMFLSIRWTRNMRGTLLVYVKLNKDTNNIAVQC